jgi:hypothetical protein
MAKDVLSMEETIRRVERILTDMHSEPYVPKLFSTKDPPNAVSVLDLLFVPSTLLYT